MSRSTSPRIGSSEPTDSWKSLIRCSENVQDAFLDRVLAEQVVDPHGRFWPIRSSAADALLDPHRVPRQVVVDHEVAELEVAALAAGLGGDQDLIAVPGTFGLPLPCPPGPSAR